jgi:hypothetical protein
MKICDYCGRENSDANVQCSECGCQDWKDSDARPRKLGKGAIVAAVAAFAVAALLWYWHSYLTYEGEVSHFEKRIRRDVNPSALQSWATNLLYSQSASNGTQTSLRSSNFPADIQQLNRSLLFGFVMPDASEERAHVRIIWGSGMRGHWGLRVGSTNFVDSGSEMWRPGVYFWREMKR